LTNDHQSFDLITSILAEETDFEIGYFRVI